MTNVEDYLFMNDNIGKSGVITNEIGTLDEHIGYNGEVLTIEDVDDDGFYILNGGHWCADDNEFKIIQSL
jgi:hypothetical protein